MVILTNIIRRLFSVYAALMMLIFNTVMPGETLDIDHSADNTNYPYIFVHGYFGWGQFNEADEYLPYWGLSTGNDVKAFNQSGYTAASADVDPVGSAWDRACELYAQLTGTVVDYGKAHSEKYGHERYGEDYSGRALIDEWDSENKINIVSHSFGGPTCALFASILEYGADEELSATQDETVSEFFTGGKGDYIYSISGIAGAYNGTAMCILADDVGSHLPTGKYIEGDNGLYDMHPDNAAALNETIRTVDSIYYFTVPCCSSKDGCCGGTAPNLKITDLQFLLPAFILSNMKTETDGGIVVDDTWLPNDGVVNTISEIGPFNAQFEFFDTAPCPALADSGFETGIYNVFPTYIGSHMSVMGNITKPNPDGRDYLVNLMQMINAL